MPTIFASSYTPTAWDTICYDLLNRVVSIQKLIPNPEAAGSFVDAIPRFWDVSPGVFPRFYNRIANMAPADQRQGENIYPDTLLVEMRLIVGTLSSGYLGEREDTFNKLVYPTMNIFRQRPYLDDPTPGPTQGTSFPYLAPRRNATPVVADPGGFHGYTFESNSPTTLYMGGGFILTVNIRTELGRLS